MILAADSRLVAALHPSPCFEPRRDGAAADMLLLHYTGMASCERAIDWLSRPDSRVSCHYVIDVDGRITQMVAESERAWHAGLSIWAGECDINSRSIGVEIHNPGHDGGYPDFPERQMQAVIALGLDVVRRRRIRPERVLAHSDVAPLRKNDPGERFDWACLARAGLGHWVEPAPPDAGDAGLGPSAGAASVATAQDWLAAYGYGLERTGAMDDTTVKVVTAFQRHFRPARVDGRLDRSTFDTLARLIEALGEAEPIVA